MFARILRDSVTVTDNTKDNQFIEFDAVLTLENKKRKTQKGTACVF